MNDRRVVTATKGLTDFDELHFQELTSQVHRDLPRYCERLDPGLRSESLRGDTPAPGDNLLNLVDGWQRLRGSETIFTRTNLVGQRLPSELDRYFLVLQRCE